MRGSGRMQAPSDVWGITKSTQERRHYTAAEAGKVGMRFFRRQSQTLEFGNATLNLVGVDYQRRGKSKYLRRGRRSDQFPARRTSSFPIIPTFFLWRPRKDYDLTISGHTHGGQVNFEILEKSVNIARFFTPYIYGRYVNVIDRCSLHEVLVTVGAPAVRRATGGSY